MPTIYALLRDRLLVVDGEAGTWQTWTRLQDHDLECLAAPSARPDLVLVGTFDEGLYRSTDGGDSFDRVGDWMEESITALAASPRDPDRIWAGAEPSRVYRSTDGGQSWTDRPGLTALESADEWSFPPRPDTHHVRWIEPDPHESGRLYVGIEAGAILRTENGGKTWIDRPADAPRDPHSFATHPDDPQGVWVAAGEGCAKSEDGGDTWTYHQDGLKHRYCWSIKLDPGDPETALMSAASGPGSAHSTPGESYVYRRSGDVPWARIEDDVLPTGTGVLRSMLATDGPGEFYALNNRGLYHSPDAGRSWRQLAVEWPEGLSSQTPRGLAVV